MILRNATIYNDDFVGQRADIEIEGEKIKRIDSVIRGEDEVDLSGLIILPGFIDIHIHGSMGADMSDGKASSVDTMSRYLAANGITSFCPASMTMTEEEIAAGFRAVEEYKGNEAGAYIHGINMEGPFISFAKKGAQPGNNIRKPDIDEFLRLNSISRVALVDVAPEVEGAFEFAEKASEYCTVSIAHTDADFETATESFKHGFSHATHLYSAMPPIENRKPGAVTAVFDNETVTAELICDGLHAHPPILRMSFKLLGEDRAVVVSDAMKAAGCGDGEFDLGGQKVYVKNGKATLADGTFAASTANIYKEFLNLLRFGIPFKSALKACTINPARVIGADSKTGSIAVGKNADLIAVDSEMNLKKVFIRGHRPQIIREEID